jgi:hypothetical protein
MRLRTHVNKESLQCVRGRTGRVLMCDTGNILREHDSETAVR